MQGQDGSGAREPEWFDRALQAPSESAVIEVDGVPIHYVTWGAVGKPGVVLVHGSNAHLEWWRFVAPFMTDHFRVAAIDLSGNGDSGWRDRYSARGFADEIMAVARAAELGEKPYIVGHSFGGWVVLQTAHFYGEQLSGVLMMDFTVAPPERYTEWGLRAEREGVVAGRKTRVYEDREQAISRFRFIPEQPSPAAGLMRWLGEQSIREVEGGWTWKFDPAIFDYLEMGEDQVHRFAGLKCPAAVMLGEHSTDEGAQDGQYMRDISGGHLPVITLPCTHHHMMFEEPMAVVMMVLATLLGWHAEANRDAQRTALQSTVASL